MTDMRVEHREIFAPLHAVYYKRRLLAAYPDHDTAEAHARGGPGAVVTENEHERAVVDHLRGNCHNSAICLICTRERERNTETMRINEIIGG